MSQASVLSIGPNDGLMAIFFLLIGLELEREIYIGELSNFKNALLPIVAAIGGMLAHFTCSYLFLKSSNANAKRNWHTHGNRYCFCFGRFGNIRQSDSSLIKSICCGFAVIDDLGAIVLIAVFYTAKLSDNYLLAALLVWAVLILLNRVLRVMSLLPYLIGGMLMWFFMLKSGVHATVAGIMLAFAIPFSAKDGDPNCASHRLRHFLHKPAAFIILPMLH